MQWEVVRRAFGDGHDHPGPHRRSEAGHLRLPRRRRLRLSGRRPAGGQPVHPGRELAQRRRSCWRPTTPFSIPFTSAIPISPIAPVAATAAHRRPGLLGGARRHAPASPSAACSTTAWSGAPQKGVQKDAALEWVARDLAADIVGLLSSRPRSWCGWRDRRGGRRPVLSPATSRVLVRTNRQAGLVQEALRAVGVPAVVGGTESVFGSPSAPHWLRLLEALEQPASRPRAVAVALTPFVGMTADEVAGGRRSHLGGRCTPASIAGPASCAGGGVATADPGHRGRRGTAGPAPAAAHRRTRPHRPRPHRRVAARRGVHRPARTSCPAGLARPADRGGRQSRPPTPRTAAGASIPTPTRCRS